LIKAIDILTNSITKPFMRVLSWVRQGSHTFKRRNCVRIKGFKNWLKSRKRKRFSDLLVQVVEKKIKEHKKKHRSIEWWRRKWYRASHPRRFLWGHYKRKMNESVMRKKKDACALLICWIATGAPGDKNRNSQLCTLKMRRKYSQR
jgi:hypothetical protein